MLQDDFDRLMEHFQLSDPSKINLEEIMREVLQFFTSLKREIMDASPEEREEIFSNLSTMYTQLMEMTSKLAGQMGISEQELLRLAEDMKNFTPDQRQLIEKTKEKMMSEVADLGRVLQKGPSKEEKRSSRKQERKPPETPRITRSKWVRP